MAEMHAKATQTAPNGCPGVTRAVVYYRHQTHRWQLMRSAPLSDRTPIASGKSCRWARYAAEVHRDRAHAAHRSYERQIAREHQHPKWIALRLLHGNRQEWGCLMYIVSLENATMDPTLDYGRGHGNVYEAYGIPQANPGTKMASAGPDWRTNPETQLRWMIHYSRVRYGSLCGAAYSRRVRGMY